VKRLQKLAPLALATLSGVLYFVAFVDFGQWVLVSVALVPLLLALQHTRTGKGAFFLSWWMGLSAMLGGYYWVVHLLRTFAYLPLPLAFGGYFLLCVAQGGLFAVFGWLAWLLRKRTGLRLGWTAPLGLIAAEFTYPLLFPSYFANHLAFVPHLTQVVDLGGVLLLSGMLALFNGAIAEAILALRERRRPPLALSLAAAFALVFDLGYSALRIRQMETRDAAAPKLKTAIVQANVGAGDKHLRATEGIQRFKRMTDAAMETPGVGLVVWPESGLNRVVIGDANLTGQVATDVKVPMIVGALRGERRRELESSTSIFARMHVWNTVLALEPGGQVLAHYDKVKLLVFGEYVPFEKELGFLYKKILPYTSAYQRGTTFAPLPVGPYRLSADVCYEDILPRHIRDLMGPLDSSGQRPHAMVNVTNDSWYGPAEPPIHLALAVFRSIEHRRWLIRSTATGISAFVDSSGRLVQKSGFETEETLVADVPMVTAGPTVYGVIGDVVGWLALAFAVAAIVQRRFRPREAEAPASTKAKKRAA